MICLEMTQWYYGSEGQQNGPVADHELHSLIAQGVIIDSTLVWREGMVTWQAKATVPELQAGASPLNMAHSYYPAMANMAPNSGLAIASMVCGIVSILFCYVHAIVAIPAVICGHMALKRINDSPVPMAGRGMAIAGLVTGYIALFFQICWIGFFIYAFNQASSHSSSTFGP
jgi:hypothetical protein